jgi:hypothetical protein
MPVGCVSLRGSLHLPAVDEPVAEQDEDDEDITDGENTSSPLQRGREGGSPTFGMDVNCVGDNLEDDDEDCELEDHDELEDVRMA